LGSWLKAYEAGKLNGPRAKAVTAEQMELEIARKAAFFAKDLL
jgi:transposase